MPGMRIKAKAGMLGIAALFVAGCGGTPGASIGGASTLVTGTSVPTMAPTVVPSPKEVPGPTPRVGHPALASMPGWLVYQIRLATSQGLVLRLIRTDGTEDHTIATDIVPTDPTRPDDHIIPEWSSDGTQLIFTRFRAKAERRDLFAYDLATNTSRELVHCDDPCVDATEAALAPDGQAIVYFFAEGAVDAQGIPADCGLRILSLTTGKTEDLTRSPCGLVEERYPDWSPDGDRIVFLRTVQDVRGGPWVNTSLVIRDLKTNAEATIAVPALDVDELDWSPDGRRIAYVTERTLEVVDLVANKTETLVDLDTADTGFDSTFDQIRHPRFTSDGTAVIVGINQTDGAGTAVRRDPWVAWLDGRPMEPLFPTPTAENERGFYTRISLQPVP